ncbi:MAG: hypothetical protein FWF56_06515 [Firmicutes bacterium]|nr:hypothetical protein [Bacillota bacterium]
MTEVTPNILLFKINHEIMIFNDNNDIKKTSVFRFGIIILQKNNPKEIHLSMHDYITQLPNT